jgi:hypothetical protein
MIEIFMLPTCYVPIYIRCSQVEEVTVVSSSICFLIRQNFARVLRNERSFSDLYQALHAESFDLVIALEDNQRQLDSILHHSVLTQKFVALTYVVALEQHRRIGVVEVGDQSAIDVVPVLERDLSALTVLRDAAGKRNRLKFCRKLAQFN